MINNLKSRYYSFEHSLKELLNELNPDPTISIRKGFWKRDLNNIEILFVETYFRSALLVIRVVKSLYATTLCISSPLHLFLGEKLPPPNLAWKRFCKEVRLLSAESFELIGVIVCSILLLPFNRKKSHYLINAQIWVEKTAEWISGERANIHRIQKVLDPIKEKKAILLEIAYIIDISKEEWWDRCHDPLVDYNDILSRIGVLKNRRISRDYDFISSLDSLKEQLDKKLEDFSAIISDRIIPIAIPKKEELLDRLKKLYPQSKYNSFPSCNESDPLEKKLQLFQQLDSEIQKIVSELHNIHDPSHIIKDQLQKLDKELGQIFPQIIEDAFKNGSYDFPRLQRAYNRHFFDARKKFNEIYEIYLYENLIHSSEDLSEKFVPYLIKQIHECQKLLQHAYLTWEAKGTISLDRKRALTILELSETATNSQIRQAYLRLSKKYHPDKRGGRGGEVFVVIKEAYQFLNPSK